jgi:hypothetical protein
MEKAKMTKNKKMMRVRVRVMTRRMIRPEMKEELPQKTAVIATTSEPRQVNKLFNTYLGAWR